MSRTPNSRKNKTPPGLPAITHVPPARKTSHREPEEKRQKRLGDPGQASSSEEPVAHVTEVETMALGTLAAAAAAAPAAAPAPAQPPVPWIGFNITEGASEDER